MFSKAPSLTSHAEHLADLFSLVPGVREVALFGSLARIKDYARANDIDLAILHDGSLPNCSFTVLRDKVIDPHYGDVLGWKIKEGEDPLKRLLGDRVHPIRRYIVNNVDCRIDFICANYAVLTDCDALKGFSVTCPDPEFSNRVFCETPLLKFDVVCGTFYSRESLKHKDGSCCKPKVPWETVRELRKHKLESLLNLIPR